jgi:hypothetical protein
VVLLVLPVVLLVGSAILVHQAGTDRLTKAIAEVERLDPAWRLDDIEATRQPFPAPEKNGMARARAVAAAKANSPAEQWSFPQFENDNYYVTRVRQAMEESLNGDRKAARLLNPEQLRVLRVELQRNAEALALARTLIECESGRFPLTIAPDWFSTNFTHCQEPRVAARLLRYDAWLRAQAGDMTGALQNVQSIVNAGRAIGDEPSLISQLVHMAMAATAVATLEKSLGLGQATEAELLALQKCLLGEAQTSFYLNGIRGERAGFDHVLQGIENRQLSFAKLREMTGIGPGDRVGNLVLLQMYLTIRAQRAEVLECLTEAVELGKLPAPKQKLAFAAVDQKFRQMNRLSLARLIVPAFGRIAEADLRTKAILLTAVAGLAAERFRLANGRWPRDLAELTPAYLDAVPLDPFDGQPLRFKKSDGTLVIYSVGIDAVDDGGQLDEKPFQPGSDIGFRLFDPEKRRQPALPFVLPAKDASTDDGPGEPDVKAP